MTDQTPHKQTDCTAAPGTTDCKRSTQEPPEGDGWAIVHEEWWCDNCMDRYGFIPDKPERCPQPLDEAT
jgi:uncharacterized membrane protein